MKKAPNLADLHQVILARDVHTSISLSSVVANLNGYWRGQTALSLAVQCGLEEVVNALIKAGASLDQKSRDHLGRIESPLVSSLRLRNPEISKTLITNGALLDTKDFYSRSPLWYAVHEKMTSLVTMLLENQSPIDFTQSKLNPVYLSAEHLDHNTCRWITIQLIAAGLPTHSEEDSASKSPLFYSLIFRDDSLFRLANATRNRLTSEELSTFSYMKEQRPLTSSAIRWIDQESKSPFSLVHLSIVSIRYTIMKVKNSDIRQFITVLPLPVYFKTLIQLQKQMDEALERFDVVL